MEHANLPSLVAVLYQLTGDRRYLADPYRPTRSRGMEDNDPGGFAPEVQAEIRAAAVDAVLAWAGGRPPAVPAPTGDALLELIELAVGEPVPPEYEAMAAEDMGFTAPKAPDRAAVGLPGGRHRRGRVGHARRDPAGRGGHRPRGAGEERRRRRHLAGERLPRRGRRHPEPPLLLLVRAAALVHPLRQARRGAHLPARRGRRPRPAQGHPVRHRGGERGLPRPALDRHHRRGRDAHRGRRDHRRRAAQPAEDPRAAGPGHVPGPAVPLGALARGPRRHRQAGGGRRHRGERDADRARDRRARPGTSPCSSARRSGPRPTTCTSPPSTTPRRC